jgi:hypothetical protein
MPLNDCNGLACSFALTKKSIQNTKKPSFFYAFVCFLSEKILCHWFSGILTLDLCIKGWFLMSKIKVAFSDCYKWFKMTTNLCGEGWETLVTFLLIGKEMVFSSAWNDSV